MTVIFSLLEVSDLLLVQPGRFKIKNGPTSATVIKFKNFLNKQVKRFSAFQNYVDIDYSVRHLSQIP